MRQVPGKYLIIGRGRLASHLANYFALADIPFAIWTRDQSFEFLKQLAENSERILLAIKDSAIESFVQQHRLPVDKVVHFSGTLSTPLAVRLHPLMTFTKDMYTLEDYQKIPFIGEMGQPTLSSLIPELNNPFFTIAKGQQDLYHALCVLSGNGTVVLWQAVINAFSEQLQLPKEVLLPYLERVALNLKHDASSALTGPWVRSDGATISKNQNALSATPLLHLYNSLLNSYQSFPAPRAEVTRSFL